MKRSVGARESVHDTGRVVACTLLGSALGTIVGPLFVPDPTSVLADGLTVLAATAIGGSLYHAGWLEGD